MSDGFMLDTPQQINMWVLLSRRSQIKLQLKGLNTPGLVKWCKANIPGAEKARTAKDCIIPVEYAISEAGGPPDFTFVNVHVMEQRMQGVFVDEGVYPDMDAVEAIPRFVDLYNKGRLEIVFTLDEPREPNGQIYTPA